MRFLQEPVYLVLDTKMRYSFCMTKVLITGGSEGIGFEFAKIYSETGASVFLCARDMVKLQDARTALQNAFHHPVSVIAQDLSEPGAALKVFEKAGGDVDVLISCAGFGFTGESWKIDLEKEEKMVAVNDIALMSLSKLYLKEMIARGAGTILNVASTGGLQAGPFIAGYYASKAFVISYTKAIAKEAAPYGVKVYCLCPGPVDTAFYAKEGLKTPRFVMDKEKCARYAYRHMNQKVMIVPGVINRLCLLVPSGMRTAFVKRSKKRILDKGKTV